MEDVVLEVYIWSYNTQGIHMEAVVFEVYIYMEVIILKAYIWRM